MHEKIETARSKDGGARRSDLGHHGLGRSVRSRARVDVGPVVCMPSRCPVAGWRMIDPQEPWSTCAQLAAARVACAAYASSAHDICSRSPVP